MKDFVVIQFETEMTADGPDALTGSFTDKSITDDPYFYRAEGHYIMTAPTIIRPKGMLGRTAFAVHPSVGDFQIHYLVAEATLARAGNPVHLIYKFDDKGSLFSQVNLEKGSLKQAREILSELPRFQDLLQFKQAHHGPTRSGFIRETTRNRYLDIIDEYNKWREYCLRNGREPRIQDFFSEYPGISPDQFRRARKKFPGLL